MGRGGVGGRRMCVFLVPYKAEVSSTVSDEQQLQQSWLQ